MLTAGILKTVGFLFVVALGAVAGPVRAEEESLVVDPTCVAAVVEPFESLAATPEAWWTHHNPWKSLSEHRFDDGRPAYDDVQKAAFRRQFRVDRDAKPGEIGIAVVKAEYRVAMAALDAGHADGRALMKAVLAKLMVLNQAHAQQRLDVRPSKVGDIASLLHTVIERWLRLHGLKVERSEFRTRRRGPEGSYRGFHIALEGSDDDAFPLRRQLAELARGSGTPIHFHFVPGESVGNRTGTNHTSSSTGDGGIENIALTLESLLNLELSPQAMRHIRRGIQMIRFSDQGKVSPYDGVFFRPSNGRYDEIGSFGSNYVHQIELLPEADAPLEDKVAEIKTLTGDFAGELLRLMKLQPEYIDVRNELAMWFSLFSAARDLDEYTTEVHYRKQSVDLMIRIPGGKRTLAFSLPLDPPGVVVGFPHLRYGVQEGDDALGEVARNLREALLAKRPLSLSWDQKEQVWRLAQHMLRRLDFTWELAKHRATQRQDLIERMVAFVQTPDEASYPTLVADLKAIDDPALQKRSMRGIEFPKHGEPPAPLPEGPREGESYFPMVGVRTAYLAATGKARSSVVEQIAMDAVMHYAALRGWYVVDVSRDQQGADIILVDRRTGRRWLVEVKGRGPNSPDIDLTPDEVETAREFPNRWLLAIVTVDAEGMATLHWRQNVPLQPMDPLESRRVLSVERVLERVPPVSFPIPWLQD